MVKLIIVLLLFLTIAAKADMGDLLSLNQFALDYKNFAAINPNARNLLIYPEPPKEGINLDINLDVLKYGYWDSEIQSLTTDGQYRAIGLETRLGVRLFDSLEVGYWHHSQHVLDRQIQSIPSFPVEDALELKIILFKSKEKREGLF